MGCNFGKLGELPSSSMAFKCRRIGLSIMNIYGATEYDTRSDCAGCLLRLLGVVFERASKMELSSRVCLDGRRRVRDI